MTPALSSAALDRLPRHALGIPELDANPAWRLAAAFLMGHRGQTRRAYFNDMRAWYSWCAERGFSPLEAQRHHVDAWISALSEQPQPKTGKPASPATIARFRSRKSRRSPQDDASLKADSRVTAKSRYALAVL